jgi:hypothetical protein
MLSLITSIAIIGSVQFWQRDCSASYECGLPVATSERITISDNIDPPEPGSRLAVRTVKFAENDFAGNLSVYWKQDDQGSYLAGQSLLTHGTMRVAECSHYASDKVERFIPVGFCAGYVHADGKITQYGMTFYK